MAKIYFMRHAKAEDKKDNKKDFTRELSERGKEDLKLIVKVLKSLEVGCDAIFYSEAIRCEQSAKRLCEMMKFKKKPKSVEGFYNARMSEILDFVRLLDDKFNEIFIIAHNPAITEICEFLSDSVIGNIPTSGIFGLEFDVPFAKICEGNARVLFFEYPKKYKK